MLLHASRTTLSVARSAAVAALRRQPVCTTPRDILPSLPERQRASSGFDYLVRRTSDTRSSDRITRNYLVTARNPNSLLAIAADSFGGF